MYLNTFREENKARYLVFDKEQIVRFYNETKDIRNERKVSNDDTHTHTSYDKSKFSIEKN